MENENAHERYNSDKRSHLIGILYKDDSGKHLTHPYFNLILNAFMLKAHEKGYDITFINPFLSDHYAEHCRSRGLDGVGVICTDFQDPGIKELADSGMPCVTIDHIFKGVPAVVSDNETGVQKLVEYAISKGHRRIAFVCGHNNSIVTRTRISQFNNTMAFHGLTVPEQYVRESRYHDIGSTRKIIIELLSLEARPTCILLPDDMTYFGAQEAASELKLRIPEDISFAGYDGIPITQALSLKLTTVHQNGETIGSAAADRLIDLIERPDKAVKRPTILPVELVEGATIGTCSCP